MNRILNAIPLRLAMLGLLILAGGAQAYPPTPHHTLFGMVRNQWGDPIDVTGAKIFIQTSASAGVSAVVAPSTEPGINYIMKVPMDSGKKADPYQATAFFQGSNFQLKVTIGSTIYVPIEMTFSSTSLGQPAGSTRLDLTLGIDSDGDGLPDGWEEAIIALLGGTLESITPEGDADGDGMSNRDEFLAGTFAYDPNDGFRLTLSQINAGSTIIEFLAVRDRTYTLLQSSDLNQWTPVNFRVLNGGVPGEIQNSYEATDVRILQVSVPFQSGGESNRFFKAVVE